MKLLGFGKEKLPAIINDPFKKDGVQRIYISFGRGPFHPYSWSAHGSVEFKNGDTTGEQKFNGETFDEVVVKIKAMLDSL